MSVGAEPPPAPGVRASRAEAVWRRIRVAIGVAPVLCPRPQPQAPGGVALTFDDGPRPDVTPRLLDLLAEHDARATFFLVGRPALRHGALVERILAEGHAIGSHGLEHLNWGRVPMRSGHRDAFDGHDAVQQAAGRAIRLIRPPQGGLPVDLLLRLRARGLTPALWTIDSHDWKSAATRESVSAKLRTAGPGDVVLLHDDVYGRTPPADRGPTLDSVQAYLGDPGNAAPVVTLRHTRR